MKGQLLQRESTAMKNGCRPFAVTLRARCGMPEARRRSEKRPFEARKGLFQTIKCVKIPKNGYCVATPKPRPLQANFMERLIRFMINAFGL
ncbi:hypothetical protein [Segatella baroniae]|uniref:hypothetical protein n=1 Tax=Segatella baroniae TaxID=305719 RepID=UPI00048121D5|nr:hypothetical protein [Segatella baroniae]